MTNSRASGGAYQKIDTHLATGTEATYTLTKTLTWSKYSKIIVEFNFETSATLALQFKVNADTSINQDGAQRIGGLTEIDTTALGELAGTAIITAAKIVAGTLIIYPSNSDYAAEQITGTTIAVSSDAGNKWTGYIGVAGTDITSIEILCSTSTWKAGSRISTYGVLA